MDETPKTDDMATDGTTPAPATDAPMGDAAAPAAAPMGDAAEPATADAPAEEDGEKKEGEAEEATDAPAA